MVDDGSVIGTLRRVAGRDVAGELVEVERFLPRNRQGAHFLCVVACWIFGLLDLLLDVNRVRESDRWRVCGRDGRGRLEWQRAFCLGSVGGGWRVARAF